MLSMYAGRNGFVDSGAGPVLYVSQNLSADDNFWILRFAILGFNNPPKE